MDLAAKIALAASQPAGAGTVPAPLRTADKAPVSEPAQTSATAKQKKTKPREPETVPITLRPSGDLLNKFVLKAAERTREEGRVVSAQQIILEALENI
jgi:hypothetical protein